MVHRRWPVFIAALTCCCFLGGGCDRSSSSGPDESAQRAAARASVPPRPEDPWDSCGRCHEKAELAGRTAADIRRALRQVAQMRRYAQVVTEEDLLVLQQMLAPTKAGHSGDGAPVAVDAGVD